MARAAAGLFLNRAPAGGPERGKVMTETVSGSTARRGKGGRKGLKVERIFTTPGVHPYDELRWERRDVVMTNWRDGSVNFEQRGVEFPDFWSVNAVNIVTSKYFRGAVGTPQREWSLKQLVDRVVRMYTDTGLKEGYFASEQDAEIFDHELKYALVHQLFSFNSPVWFNVGTKSPQQVSACFILSVDDTMESILDWYKEEGVIFKGGSGAGLNLSRIRSSKELLSSGGTASGPVSFMRGADASAGTIKSGGATRRAAKMVVLDVDHPDIGEFIETKAREEDKIRALRDAGFDMDLGGKDIGSVQYQNANNSVRVSDEFMHAVESDGEFGLRARMTGEVVETVKAKELFRLMAQAAWECADPGIQYDDTINDWHTNPETGRITASNPCFPADQRVVTDKGLVRIGDMVRRAAIGETYGIYTNDLTSETDPQDRIVATDPVRYMVTGTNEILELRFSDGSRLRCTPGHRIWTANRGWVHAEDLTEDDKVVRSFHRASRAAATGEMPMAAHHAAQAAATRHALELPEKWDEEFAHYLGWLIGDGCVTDSSVVTVYGTEAEQETVMPRHEALLRGITGTDRKPSVQANGTQQLRVGHEAFRAFLRALGVSDGRAADKTVPAAVYEAPEEELVAFLQGLFDADGCVVDLANGTRYVGLGSRSEELLIGVQELLASLGIAARIYRTDAKKESFRYTRKDGSEVTYGSDGPSFDLRISGRSMVEFAAVVGFGSAGKQDALLRLLDTTKRYKKDLSVRMVSRESKGFETTYNLTEPRNHSYIVSGVVVANCSEYMSLDNSSCNLASINLLKFLTDEGTFDVPKFVKLTELIITAMDVSITFADFPTEKIAETTRDYRQLGIGYANLGALLMATGHAYDSEGGRAIAAAITSLMTGVAYRRSAEIAGVVGPYAGYARNAEGHKRVMRKHAAANDGIRTLDAMDKAIHAAAAKQWQECLKLGEKHGYRNAQASLLAPTGCLTGDTLVTTDRGLMRLSEIGDVYGDRWQDLDMIVSTDEGPRQATKFFVNGEEPTRLIRTRGGYTIQGTLTHRVKVVEAGTGAWVWRRLADIREGDLVPMQTRTLVGDRRQVPLPVLDQAYYAGDRHIEVPDAVTPELAELVGYFMGDGSLHAKGLRLCVADDSFDVAERLQILAKDLFGITPVVVEQQGHREVTLSSMRLARWWKAAGFAKDLPGADHSGKGWTPRVPSAILETNDVEVYAGFLRGLFEADGTVTEGVPSLSTASESFAGEIRTLLLALGLATTTRTTVSGFGGDIYQVRLRNLDHALSFDEIVGFIGERKARLMAALEPGRSAKNDYVVLSRTDWDEIVPVGHPLRAAVLQSIRKNGGVPRMVARSLFTETFHERLGHALEYLFERVAANEDGGVQPTYDLSVPENVTYVANGMVSHNTIGLMMDCDTTGIEPDLALMKFKKLVGGGSMQIVNLTVPRALEKLGYQQEQIEAIVEYIAEHGHVVNAPGLRPEHYEVFDCAMGERAISPMGHVRMMAAVQPFLSGAISKTVNMPEKATVEDIEKVYFEGWRLGLKALAIYRDNCKVGQPLSAAGKKEAVKEVPAATGPTPPVRRRLPKQRPATVTRFSVAGAEGYMTASSYPDDGVGEVFLKLGKQGSTLAGVMDAFSMAISISLQYGVPLETWVEKFTNMRFEPAGMTDDPDIRMATSVMDYIFRRLALDHLPYEERAGLGILTAEERAMQANGEDPAALHAEDEVDHESLAQSAAIARPAEPVSAPASEAHSSMEVIESRQGRTADAPLCLTCGTKMRPAGSCYVCEGCGSTSGCS
ncbi:ribonucleoside-diphosphate reductase alpha chain [Actinomadura pelletieri DSM 43383]|uniref:Vitamin B12-dependent ribonucleotide reductase n=2 Tax=Actinomadura pelletieri TaxID=111805 RepID=A0A495QAX5_9ACTN|nr:ribonucleoside-diphosphate reductase alpha chain [Actinomadura pelletieri DSM 43383]